MPTRPPSSPAPADHDVFLALLRTADHLTRGLEKLLQQKPASLSLTQYHVLQILRQANQHDNKKTSVSASQSPASLPCHEIARRMITRDPDITRLLDRLETRGLITRSRAPADRRIVLAAITPAGLALLAPLDEPLRAFHHQQLSTLPPADRQTLARLLTQLCKPQL